MRLVLPNETEKNKTMKLGTVVLKLSLDLSFNLYTVLFH